MVPLLANHLYTLAGGCLTWQHNAADSAGGAIRLALSGRADLRNREATPYGFPGKSH
ncbi:MAG: hypothetical protein VB089_15515 [Anaerolineaceae bacterium]|jgi:hypothetical protein|nr:hypothetical protein [Anaerolineaceae bacterium]